jgi:hypothetical protein
MSRLSDAQIRAMIAGCKATAERYEGEGRPALARRSRRTAKKYEDEMAARARGEAVQEPQAVRFGK